jgi:heme-degrading monooxygenase HmoA
MIFKWIHCKSSLEQRSAFSKAQKEWGSISNAPGFIAQFGGWDLKDNDSACIISLWKDQDSFDHFMENLHDPIVEKNNQSATYYDSEVTFFFPLISMPGKFEDLVSAIHEGKFMRVADCQVYAHSSSHFEDVQKSVWIPEMNTAKGMLGGQFNKKDQRYLVTTLWDEEFNHEEYAKTKVPVLRKKADVSMDLESIIGRFIKLESSWLILP